MTETDLVTAGSSSESVELPNTVNSEFSSPATADVPIGPPAADSTPATDAAPTTDAGPATDSTPATDAPAAKASGSLSSMVLPELRALANEAGVKGASGMRKSELIAAIRERRGEASNSSTDAGSKDTAADNDKGSAAADTTTDNGTPADSGEQQGQQRRERRGASRDAGSAGERNKQDSGQDAKDGAGSEKNSDRNKNQNQNQQDTKQDGGDQQGNQQNRGDDDGEGRQGRRGRRFRDRRRRGDGPRGEGGNGETELRDDDVVQPVAGILDVLDNYAFVRTSGYLAGPNDVYVSMNMVRKNGLRRGDAITGAVRVPKDGEQPNQRQKFNPLVRLDTVNGGPVEDAKKRPDFTKLTPLYPNERLRLETTPDRLTTRVIDLIMPIGKGQRALIVSPPKAGKTTILQDIANGVAVEQPGMPPDGGACRRTTRGGHRHAALRQG